MFEGAVRIDGQIEGEVVARDRLVIGENAVLTPYITAASVIVEGSIIGDVTASQWVEIRPSGKVSGTITTPTLIVHAGASLEGHCAVPSDALRREPKTIEALSERCGPLDLPPDMDAPRTLALLEEERDRPMASLCSIREALLLLAPDGSVQFANEEAEGSLGLPAGGLAIGKSLEVLLGEANALVRVVNTARRAETGLFDVLIEIDDGATGVHFLVSVFVTGRGRAGATLLVVARSLDPRCGESADAYDIDGAEPES